VTIGAVSVSRRSVLTASLAAAVGAIASGCAEPSQARWTAGGADPVPGGSEPPMPRLTPVPTASPGTKARQTPTKLATTLSRFLKPTPENPKHPTFAGAVALVSVGG
jgi:hypothetical protein